MEYIAIASEKKGHYPLYKLMTNNNHGKDSKQNILFVLCIGEEAERIEKLSEDEVKEEIYQMLLKGLA